MTKLSLCTIVKNEEASLPKCLESVKDLVDEIVILDTGSTDQTVEVAKKFGANVTNFTWCDDFAAARNEALKYVRGEWVLVLDADEVLNAKIVSQMQQAMADENHLVVNLIRQEIGAAQSPYSLTSRLFRNHPKIKFSHPYHALIDDSVIQLLKKEPYWKIVDLPSVAILHYGYQPEAIRSLDKSARARQAMEKFLAQHPHDPYTCSKLGGLYLQIGQEKEGIKLLKRGLKSNQADAHVLYELHYHLANAYVRKQQLERAGKHYQKAIKQPILPQLKLGAYNNLGSLLQAGNDLNNAEKVYQMALNIDPTFAIGYYNLGMVLKAKGSFQEAIAAYQQAIKYDPNYAPAHQNLGLIYLRTGNLPESTVALKRAISLYEVQNPEQAERLRQGILELGYV
jgi:glycosyltransferase involved in cell wall biosynthesis